MSVSTHGGGDRRMLRTNAQQLALLLLVAFALRLGAGLAWQSRLGDARFGFGDSESYWRLGRAIAQGKPYAAGPDARVFRTPGYPLLLAPIFLLAGSEASVLWARAESALFGVLAVGGVWWLARRLSDQRAAMAAAAMAAIYPGVVILGGLVLSEAPFLPLLILQLSLWTAAWQCRTPGKATASAVVAGLAAGAATLVRPSWLLFTPFALAVAMLASGPRRRHLGLGGALLLGLVIAMTPWWIRNALVTGRFVPTTLQVGASLYDGLNPTATGASNMDFVPAMVAAERRDPAGEGGDPADSFEYRLDQRMRHEALAWAQTHPGRVVELAGIKFLRLWNVWPNEAKFSIWPIRIAVLVSYVPIVALGLWGAWRTLGRGWPYWLCWLPAVYLTALHLVFVSSIRYREPAMLALMVLAAGMVVRSPRGHGGEDAGSTVARRQ